MERSIGIKIINAHINNDYGAGGLLLSVTEIRGIITIGSRCMYEGTLCSDSHRERHGKGVDACAQVRRDK
jgi:hypothetical protein